MISEGDERPERLSPEQGCSSSHTRRRRLRLFSDRARVGGMRLASPMSWPVALRRAALIALPLALPLWVALVVLGSLFHLGRDAATVIRHAWSAPPRRRFPNSYRSYSRK